MERLADLPTPAAVVDLDRLEANLDRMAERARRWGVALRPHVKTHKCAEIALLQTERGARGLTVSTLAEARAFLDAGFDDLTWAFPVVLDRLGEASELAGRGTLRLVVDSEAAVAALAATGLPFHVWLKVDCGYHRAGVDPDGPEAGRIAARLAGSKTLVFDGLLTHSGHAYHAASRRELERIAAEEREVTVGLAERLRRAGIEVPGVSIGSTPALAAAAGLDRRLDGITEIRPGNYAFYDYTQTVLGAAAVADCAFTVIAAVVSSRPAADRSVANAGALVLSKDAGPGGAWGPAPDPAHSKPVPVFLMGEVFESYEDGLLSDEIRVLSVSQEHAVLSAALPVGERVRILPNHSCLAVANFDEVFVARGDRVVARWRVHRQR